MSDSQSRLEPRVIQSDKWQVGILPETGGSIAFGRVNVNGQWHDFFRPTPEKDYAISWNTASYVLSPWSNRIRDGHFRFKGKDYQLKVNFPDGTAIHGTAKDYSWKIDTIEPSKIFLSFLSTEYENVNFPWKFSTRQDYRVDGPNFTVTIWLKNEDTEAFPAGFGHHPYLMRTLTGPEDTLELQIPCNKYFVLDKCMPSAGPVPVEPRVDFRKPRPMGTVFIDDCLTDRIGEEPMRIHFIKSGVNIAYYFDSLYENVVFYLPENETHFALEAVTNANDGFNLMDQGIEGHNVFVLQPGEERRATFTLQVQG